MNTYLAMTEHDKQQCAEVHAELQDACQFCDDGTYEAICCCGSASEIVLLSTGYAEVWSDGEVIQRNKTVWTVE